MKNLKHVGIIPDGMRRWSTVNKYPLIKTYLKATQKADSIISLMYNNNVEIISVYALSNDNTKRNFIEYNAIIKTLTYFIKNELESICKDWEAKFLAIGKFEDLKNFELSNAIIQLERKTSQYDKRKIYALINYDPLIDIKEACTKQNLEKTKLDLHNFSQVEEPVDLLIRTGSAKRISNFLPLHLGYSEFFFIEKLFIDTDINDFNNALEYFKKINRKFGK